MVRREEVERGLASNQVPPKKKKKKESPSPPTTSSWIFRKIFLRPLTPSFSLYGSQGTYIRLDPDRGRAEQRRGEHQWRGESFQHDKFQHPGTRVKSGQASRASRRDACRLVFEFYHSLSRSLSSSFSTLPLSLPLIVASTLALSLLPFSLLLLPSSSSSNVPVINLRDLAGR